MGQKQRRGSGIFPEPLLLTNPLNSEYRIACALFSVKSYSDFSSVA